MGLRMALSTVLKMGVLLSLALLLGSCTSIPDVKPSAQELAQVHRFLAAYPELDAEEETRRFLHMTEEMKSYTDLFVRRKGGAGERLTQIFKSIHDPSTIGVTYDVDAHFNAEQVFKHGRANCLSYSALFVSMSRHVGLQAKFQEVDLPPSWSLGDKDLLLRFRHVNVMIPVGSGREKVADFRLDRFSHFYPRRVIGDHVALSLHYNNLAIEAMFEDDWEQVFKHLKAALVADPKRVVAWSNLGIALRRNDRLDLAEIAYRHALHLNSRDYSVMNNLAQLYRLIGRGDLASFYNDRSSSHRLKNPYFHFANAQREYRAKNYDAALEHVNSALRLQKKEGNFLQLKAFIFWAQEERARAVGLMEEAFSIEESFRTKKSIQEQLDKWRKELQ